MAEESHPAYLSPSELGTKDYWENYYARTLAHISHEAPKNGTNALDKQNDDDAASTTSDLNEEDDPGTSWFSEHNAPQKVLHFLTRKSFPLSPRNTVHKKGSHQPSVLDLGTGNGSMLALLRKRGGYKGRLVGVDYSRQSVELARELQRVRGHSAYRSDSENEEESDDEEEAEDAVEIETETGSNDLPEQETSIQFEEWDILGSKALLSETGLAASPSSPSETLPWFPYQEGGFDIVLDKGTFDAVSLADDAKTTRVCERYPDIARRLVRRGGFLIVTTCNWTEEELVQWFTGARTRGDRLAVWGRVEYPRFRFGGHEGQGVCTVCFQRLVNA
ncbi:S-adenosylmethionine-dependent methyltransferase, putative [Penicillium digitatum]|uniref:Protein-lysine N-methyltransferase EFM4 n=3 Tax=Penicillium digitatum TaxID=36651 RepID=K9FIX7_PEND2|nr:S-adenosylmethionine-dependent methyltransferase, putative [Penicillium digitatum Pd1]EKV07868.1 S-adenosylmethionine-dependent methyltransferase, putative [Penicillium digitatum Pd1]EKV09455.1 S-adenosylmethionine-dependent methyltransferase, putative [Penicillium digitatum PHI26]QQK41438.1 S-adenosylmethionine-dependent methyltransferase, putative [Penicillium digitatum]